MFDAALWSEVERRVAEVGVDEVLAGETLSTAEPNDGLPSEWRRVLDAEAHHLRGWDRGTRPEFLAQQVLTRAHAVGASDLVASASRQIDDGHLLVLCERWRTQPFSPALLRTLTGHTAAVVDVAFSSTGRVYSLDADHAVRVWEAATGRSDLLELPDQFPAGVAPSSALAVSGDGIALAVACSDAGIRIIDTADGTVVATLTGHRGSVTRLCFVDDGTHRLVSASTDGTVRLWNVDSATPLHVLKGHRGGVGDIAVGRGGETLVSCSSDGTIRVWDGRSGRSQQVVEHKHEFEHGFPLGGVRLAMTCLDRVLLVGSGKGALHSYVLDHGRLGEPVLLQDRRQDRVTPGRAWRLVPVGTQQVLVTNDDAVVDVWRADSRAAPPRRVLSLTGHGFYTKAAATRPDGTTAVTGDDLGRLLLWNLDTPPAPEGPLGSYFELASMAVSESAGLVVGCPREELRITARDVRTGRVHWRLDEPGSRGPDDMWFSRDGRTLLAVRAGVVELRSAESGALQHEVSVPGTVIGRRANGVITTEEDHASGGHRVAVVQAATGVPWRQVSVPRLAGYLRHAAASPDLRRVLLAQFGSITTWSTDTGDLTTTPLARQPSTPCGREMEADVLTVAIDDEGCHALAADAAGRAHIWEIGSGQVSVGQADTREVRSADGLADHRAVTVGVKDGVAIVWDLIRAVPVCTAPLDSSLTAVATDGNHVAAGDIAGNTHSLVLLQGGTTPPRPVATTASHAAPAPPSRGLLRRLLGHH